MTSHLPRLRTPLFTGLLALLAFLLLPAVARAQVDIVFEKATYHGDAFEENGLMALFIAKTTATGKVTGSLQIPGRTIPFRGEFSATGQLSLEIRPSRGFAGGTLTLTMANDTQGIEGTFAITGGTTYEIAAERAKAGTRRDPVAEAGYFTAVTTESMSDLPSSPITITVAPTGAIRMKGRLADGTAFSTASHLSVENNFPIFAPLYKKAGFFAGKGNIFEDEFEVDELIVGGDFVWRKPIDDAEDPGAVFEDTMEIFGRQYVQPGRGERILDGYDLDDGAAVAEAYLNDDIGYVSVPFTWTTANKAVFDLPNEHKVRLTFQVKTGLFSGQFRDLDGRVRKFYGICVQSPSDTLEEDFEIAVGFYVDADGFSQPVDLTRLADVIDDD